MNDFKLARCYKGEGRWYIYYFFINHETGKYVRFREFISDKIKNLKLKNAEAKARIDKINDLLLSGWSPFETTDPAHYNIIKAIDKIIEIKKQLTERKRSINTYNNIRNIFVDFVKKTKLEHISISYFSKKHAYMFMDYCLKDRHYSKQTYNNMLSFLKSFFNEMIRRQFINTNPFNGIDHIKCESSMLTSFTPEELTTINSHLPAYNYPLYAVTYIIFHAYIRLAEITRLKIGDIDMKKRLIFIRPEVSKNKKASIIGMQDQLYEVLDKMNLGIYPAEYYIFSKKLLPGMFLIHPNRLHDAWRLFAKEHHINKTLYKLKHTGAGMSVEAGANIRDLQLQLRHSSLEMTQIYLDKFKQVVGSESLKKFANFGDKNDENATPIIHMAGQK
jgi:integrase